MKKTKKYSRFISNYLSKLYKLLNEPYIFSIKKLNKLQGYCDSDEICIDYRKDILSTLIHEVLHYYYPNWSETKVLNEERKIINYLTIKQVKNILRRFTSII